MNITISNLQQEDHEQWKTLYHLYAEFYSMPMNEEILDNVWGWIFDSQQAFYCLVAKDDKGNAIGLMHYRAMQSPIRGRMVGFLDDLYVLAECRGHGVVDQLFSALKESAQEKGWPMVRWLTADDNYRGRGVYDKLAEKTPWLTYQMGV